MTAPRLISPALFRASAPLFRVPGTAQVLDFSGFVTGVTGVPGFSCAHEGVRAGVHPCACGHAITRAHPPRHTHHTRHKMSKNKDLDCSGYPEQPQNPGTTAPSGASGLAADRENLAAFARRLGVNRSTVTRAAQAGRLVLADDGRVCITASLAKWHATRGGRDDVAARHAAERGLPVAGVAPGATTPATAQNGPTGAEEQGGEASPPAHGSRAFYEAEKVRWQNAELLLAMDLDSGVRIPRGLLQREAHGLGATLRATVERVIDQTAPRLAAATTAEERRRLLTGEMHAARRLLKREFSAAMRRLRPDGSAPVRVSVPAEAQESAT